MSASPSSFRCQARAQIDNSWQVGAGYAATVNLYLSNAGAVALAAPYSVALVGQGYGAVLGSWNMDNPLISGGAVHAVASQSWQALAPQRANAVNLGLTLSGDGNDFLPRQVLVQGVACELVSSL